MVDESVKRNWGNWLTKSGKIVNPKDQKKTSSHRSSSSHSSKTLIEMHEEQTGQQQSRETAPQTKTTGEVVLSTGEVVSAKDTEKIKEDIKNIETRERIRRSHRRTKVVHTPIDTQQTSVERSPLEDTSTPSASAPPTSDQPQEQGTLFISEYKKPSKLESAYLKTKAYVGGFVSGLWSGFSFKPKSLDERYTRGTTIEETKAKRIGAQAGSVLGIASLGTVAYEKAGATVTKWASSFFTKHPKVADVALKVAPTVEKAGKWLYAYAFGTGASYAAKGAIEGDTAKAYSLGTSTLRLYSSYKGFEMGAKSAEFTPKVEGKGQLLTTEHPGTQQIAIRSEVTGRAGGFRFTAKTRGTGERVLIKTPYTKEQELLGTKTYTKVKIGDWEKYGAVKTVSKTGAQKPGTSQLTTSISKYYTGSKPITSRTVTTSIGDSSASFTKIGKAPYVSRAKQVAEISTKAYTQKSYDIAFKSDLGLTTKAMPETFRIQPGAIAPKRSMKGFGNVFTTTKTVQKTTTVPQVTTELISKVSEQAKETTASITTTGLKSTTITTQPFLYTSTPRRTITTTKQKQTLTSITDTSKGLPFQPETKPVISIPTASIEKKKREPEVKMISLPDIAPAIDLDKDLVYKPSSKRKRKPKQRDKFKPIEDTKLDLKPVQDIGYKPVQELKEKTSTKPASKPAVVSSFSIPPVSSSVKFVIPPIKFNFGATPKRAPKRKQSFTDIKKLNPWAFVGAKKLLSTVKRKPKTKESKPKKKKKKSTKRRLFKWNHENEI